MRRRDFLKSTGWMSAAMLWPTIPPIREEKSKALVVIELTGGNDALNTLVPYANRTYKKARPTLALGRDQVTVLDERFGLHPGLAPLAKHCQSNRIALLPAVGYVPPDRSHFRSLDIWATGVIDVVRLDTGWLGRTLADLSSRFPNASPAAFHLDTTPPPLAYRGTKIPVAGLTSLDDLELKVDRDTIREVVEAARRSPTFDDATRDIVESMEGVLRLQERLRRARARRSEAAYPDSRLGRRLRNVAQLLDAGYARAVHYVRQSGYDTHAIQARTHQGLLAELGGALAAFLGDLHATGRLDDTVVMVFSEFGRRVQENAAQGTDHGSAGMVMLAGGRVRGGVRTSWPGLDDLLDGDVRPTVDFRALQAEVVHHAFDVPLRTARRLTYASTTEADLDLFET